MKPESCHLHHHSEPSRIAITRKRACYLIRAARSRRVYGCRIDQRVRHNYRLTDCNTTIYTR